LATRVERRRYKYLKATSKRMVMGPFDCPKCGSELYFQREPSSDKVRCRCRCGLTGQWPYAEILQPVDYYNKLTDELRTKKT
jgi:transcription elongation factor Elf1